MHKIKRKLVLSIFMLVITIITLTSTTYAWFTRNQEAWIDEFELDIEATEGLWISTNNVDFSQDIGIEELKQAIQLKTGVDYSKIRYDGVTLKHNQNQKIMFNENGDALFEKDDLEAIPNTDRFSHIMVDAESKDYISFDLYFKVVTTGNSKAKYRLKLKDSSYVTGVETTVNLKNKLSTQEKEYTSGEDIIVNPQNAMRVGFSYEENSEYKLNVYEPHLGLGSSAIEGSSDPNHDKEKNAMFTHYNNTHPLSPFSKAAIDGEGFETASSFSEGVLGNFNYDEEKQEFSVLKITVYTWLEGWDADFFAGVPATKIKIKLGFELEKE